MVVFTLLGDQLQAGAGPRALCKLFLKHHCFIVNTTCTVIVCLMQGWESYGLSIQCETTKLTFFFFPYQIYMILKQTTPWRQSTGTQEELPRSLDIGTFQ